MDGVTRTTFLTARYLQQTGRDVLIFAPEGSIKHLGTSEVVNLPAIDIPAAEGTRAALPSPLVEQRLRDFQPDLIHLCSPALMSVSGMIIGRELNIPLIANYQTDLPGYAAHYGAPLLEAPVRQWLRYVHNGCHVNLAPTPQWAKLLKKQGFKRVSVWGRGVDTRKFHPAHATPAMRARLLNGQPDDHLVVLYVGRLAKEKQVDLLVDVARLEGVVLAIVGEGYCKAELEQRFAGTQAHFMGALYGEDLAQAYASADVFAFSGGQETFGQVVQEAFASGLPAVVTERGGVGALVEQGVTGYVVGHHASAFARAIGILRDQPAVRLAMRQRARHSVENRTWAHLMSELEGHYAHAQRLSRSWRRRFGFTTYTYGARTRGRLITVGTRALAALYSTMV